MRFNVAYSVEVWRVTVVYLMWFISNIACVISSVYSSWRWCCMKSCLSNSLPYNSRNNSTRVSWHILQISFIILLSSCSSQPWSLLVSSVLKIKITFWWRWRGQMIHINFLHLTVFRLKTSRTKENSLRCVVLFNSCLKKSEWIEDRSYT